ncbi:HEAT repeat domain-containing protein [Phytohabitans sp. ZYX-F-186]|uniref:HEAT repeat domain-containing protein n=1 Tax=Phytohabitans maris TaxID=3071409 RepID=A0ABU0ZGZ0_9ACTN|nr:HEAT repeat domain-containing protein [Phytohabitans sp. ZYX-F-186]MDQ7906330.1 HEAT repeat domain-containing protein [Phytohabitans sp. ZYX-F-186]
MLERLDDVDWARITHAYGPATDVPDQITDLRSADPDRREKARWQLYGNIFHQGTRYEATAYAVPFLLEILADPDGADKGELVRLLAAIAVGYDEFWLPDGLPIAEHRRTAEGGAAVLAAAPHPGDPGWDEEEGDAEYIEALTAREQEAMLAHVAVAAHEAVRQGVPLFRALLGHGDPDVRALAAYTLGWFPEDAEGSLPPLAALASSEVDEALAATARVSMGLLGVAAEFDDPRPVVRWATAIARLRVFGDRAGQEAVDELRRWSGGVGRDERVPFLDGDLVGYATVVLDRLGTP